MKTPIRRWLCAILVAPVILAASVLTAGTPAFAAALACDPAGPQPSDGTVASQLNPQLNGKMRNALNSYNISCARVVTETVKSRGFITRAAEIAITTIIVESSMANLDNGDGSSVGLFQQTKTSYPNINRNDPVAATNAFLNEMLRVYSDGSWATRPIGEVCQGVQRSNFPARYQPQAHDGTLIADTLWSGASGGGDPIPGAAAYQWGDQELVFTPSASGTLSHWYWISGQGTRSDDWGGGPIVGKTTGFAYNDQEHVFARGANNHLLHWWWTGNDGQMHYADWGGEAYSDPTAFVWNGQQHIFAKAADGNLFHWYWDPGDGNLHTVKWSGAPAAFVGNPSAFAWDNQQHVVARGPNNTLYHWWWDQSTGTVSFADWGGQAYSDPTTFVWNGQQHYFAQAADGQLFHWFWDPGDRQVHTVEWGGAPAKFIGAPFGYKFRNQQHVVARGPDNKLYHWWWAQDTGTVSFANWGGEAYSDPIAFVYNNEQQQIFTQSATNTLYHYYWLLSDGNLHQDTWGGSVKYPNQ